MPTEVNAMACAQQVARRWLLRLFLWKLCFMKLCVVHRAFGTERRSNQGQNSTFAWALHNCCFGTYIFRCAFSPSKII